MTSWYQSPRLVGLTCAEPTSSRVIRIGMETSITYPWEATRCHLGTALYVVSFPTMCVIGFMKTHLSPSFVELWPLEADHGV